MFFLLRRNLVDVRVWREYWITKVKFCITLSNVRLTLFFSVVEWMKIHCRLHWVIVGVSQMLTGMPESFWSAFLSKWAAAESQQPASLLRDWSRECHGRARGAAEANSRREAWGNPHWGTQPSACACLVGQHECGTDSPKDQSSALWFTDTLV